MLKDILQERGISVYKLSKDTGISYTTVNDIVIEKTDIKNTSANMLYRLAKYLGLSMETLYEGSEESITNIYLSNEGRNVILTFNENRIQYLGPKNLLSFHRINRIEQNVIYIDCYFEDLDGKIYCEEDYIDLSDVLCGYESVIEGKYTIIVGKRDSGERETLIDQALLVSDNLAILYYISTDIPDECVQVVSLARPKSRAVVRIKDYSVVTSTMSQALLNRAVDAVKRNIDEISEEVEEVSRYA